MSRTDQRIAEARARNRATELLGWTRPMWEQHRHGNSLAGIAVGVLTENPCEISAFAWPGGYECYAVTKSGDELCVDCAQKQIDDNIGTVVEFGPLESLSWTNDEIIMGIGHMDETDSCVVCVECGKWILASGCERPRDGAVVVHGEYCQYGDVSGDGEQ